MPNRTKLPVLLLSIASLLCFSTAMPSFAQDMPGPNPGVGGPGGGPGGPGGPMEHSFRGGERGRWWDNADTAQQVGITDDQKKQMDDIFQQHRLQLIDLNAALQKQEVMLHPLIEADQPDEAKVLSQIDAIAQARADLEKANARMLFDIRKTLTPEQWQKLKTISQNRRSQWQGRSQRWRGPGTPNGPAAPNGQSAPPPEPPSNE